MIQIKEFRSHATDESLVIRVNRFLRELDVKGQRVVELKYANTGSSEGCSVLVVYECEEEIVSKIETKPIELERNECWGYAIRNACVGVTWDWCDVGFSTKEEALSKGKEVYCSDKNCMANFSLFVGKERDYLPKIDVIKLLERIDDEVEETCLAIQKDFLMVSDQAINELSEEMNRVLQEWFVKHGQLGKAKELVQVELMND